MEETIRRAGLLVPRLQETGRKLGEGSYGEVVEVKVEGRLYAGKRLHAFFYRRDVPPAEIDAISKRFEQECLRLPHLKHPNIMQVVGVHFNPSTRQPTLVMELLHASLSEHLETHPATPPHVKHSILLGVARGLEYLHTLPPPLGPIVHRDLTANNVLLTSDITAKIADLGQARIIDKNPAQLAQSRRWTMCPGNVVHMPPEALLDAPTYDAALDVFSFGVVMLHTLTQEWPEPSAKQVPGPGGYTLVSEVERRRRYLDKIDNPLLKPLVTQCLHDNAELRPSAGDLVGALDMLVRLQQTVQQKIQEIQVLEERLSRERNENLRLQRELEQKHQQPSPHSTPFAVPPPTRSQPATQAPLLPPRGTGPAGREGRSQHDLINHPGLSSPHVGRQSSNIYEPVPGPRQEPRPPLQQYASQSRVPPSAVGLPHANVVLPSPRSTADPQLEVGSMVEVTTAATPLYGVIKWIGILPSVPYRVAGVELDKVLEGCTDGTWQGQRFFHCLPGRAFFCPIHNLKPDTRFEEPEPHQPRPAVMAFENPLKHIPLEEEADQVFGQGTFPSVEKYAQPERGIQGHQNSGYIDATLFGLFALSDVFDSLFLSKSANEIEESIKNTLWRGIVNPLRKNGAVRYESVMKLREQLDRLGKMKGVAQDEKDPEEFLNMLFKHTLHTQPFITIRRPQGEEEEFFVQLFVEPFEGPRLPSIEDLLRRMFKDQNIMFAQVPTKLLIQVPRYGRHFKVFEKIIPNLRLYIGDLCGMAGRDAVMELELLSVICIETSQYVCFTHYEGHWVFMDSMADRMYDMYNIPKGVDVTSDLNEWVYSGDERRLKQTSVQMLPEYVRRFTQDIYMCVYIQPDYGMYQ